jgi:hypothetical protein
MRQPAAAQPHTLEAVVCRKVACPVDDTELSKSSLPLELHSIGLR